MWRELPARKRDARAVIRASRRARAADPTGRGRMADRLGRTLAERLARPAPGVLAAYASLPTEPPSEAIIAQAVTAGWRVILPRMLPDKDLTWVPHDQPEEDLGADAIGEAAVVVVPALAIDRQGMRLGQGGGSYDRALARRGADAWTVAVVYDDELAAAVPTDDHDLPVDAVLTPGHGIITLPLP